MSKFFEFIKTLFPKFQSQRDRDEAYLAEAADVCDLERRMREVDQRGRAYQPSAQIAVGMR
jgi:hypothetical protein